MSERKQIRVRKPVGVLADCGPAARAKVSRSAVSRETTVAQRSGRFRFDFRRNNSVPRIRRHRFPDHALEKRPDAETGQSRGCQNPNQQFWVATAEA